MRLCQTERSNLNDDFTLIMNQKAYTLLGICKDIVLLSPPPSITNLQIYTQHKLFHTSMNVTYTSRENGQKGFFLRKKLNWKKKQKENKTAKKQTFDTPLEE